MSVRHLDAVRAAGVAFALRRAGVELDRYLRSGNPKPLEAGHVSSAEPEGPELLNAAPA